MEPAAKRAKREPSGAFALSCAVRDVVPWRTRFADAYIVTRQASEGDGEATPIALPVHWCIIEALPYFRTHATTPVGSDGEPTPAPTVIDLQHLPWQMDVMQFVIEALYCAVSLQDDLPRVDAKWAHDELLTGAQNRFITQYKTATVCQRAFEDMMGMVSFLCACDVHASLLQTLSTNRSQWELALFAREADPRNPLHVESLRRVLSFEPPIRWLLRAWMLTAVGCFINCGDDDDAEMLRAGAWLFLLCARLSSAYPYHAAHMTRLTACADDGGFPDVANTPSAARDELWAIVALALPCACIPNQRKLHVRRHPERCGHCAPHPVLSRHSTASPYPLLHTPNRFMRYLAGFDMLFAHLDADGWPMLTTETGALPEIAGMVLQCARPDYGGGPMDELAPQCIVLEAKTSDEKKHMEYMTRLHSGKRD